MLGTIDKPAFCKFGFVLSNSPRFSLGSPIVLQANLIYSIQITYCTARQLFRFRRVSKPEGDFAVHRVAFIAHGLLARGSAKRKLVDTIAFPCLLAFLLAGFACPRATGDVGVVLNESLDTSVDRISGTGHSAVYFSRICPESPVKLRLCGPGEHGSVMSNYINIGEDQPFEWNVVLLNIYLYGVEDIRNRPIIGSFKIKHVLEERYRKNYLSSLCAGAPRMN